MTAARFRRPAVDPYAAAVGALIASRRPELGVHIIEVGPGAFEIYLRLSAPMSREGAVQQAHRLSDLLGMLLPEVGGKNPRTLLIQPIPAPPRKAT